MSSPAAPTPASYEAALEELEQLIGRIESGQLPLEQLLGKTDFDLFPQHLASRYRDDDRAVVESGKIFDTVEEHVTPAGKRLYVQVMKTPVYGTDGRVAERIRCTDVGSVAFRPGAPGRTPERSSSLRASSLRCRGVSRTGYAPAATAAWMLWRIHHVAYVPNLNSSLYSYLSTARNRPRFPS